MSARIGLVLPEAVHHLDVLLLGLFLLERRHPPEHLPALPTDDQHEQNDAQSDDLPEPDHQVVGLPDDDADEYGQRRLEPASDDRIAVLRDRPGEHNGPDQTD